MKILPVTNYSITNYNKNKNSIKNTEQNETNNRLEFNSAPSEIAGRAQILMTGTQNSETKKFEKLRNELASKCEPAILELKKADWDFYTNSTDENMRKSQEANEKYTEIFRDEETYKKFKEIDKTKLPKHEAIQLKDILKGFEDELGTGEALKALRDKESEIGKKFNTAVMKLDGKNVSNLELNKILETETNPEIREKAYNAQLERGELIVQDLRELVKMRNEYAKSKGYDTYFDYMLEVYGTSAEMINKLANEILDKSSENTRTIFSKQNDELKNFFNTDKLENYHYKILLDSNPKKEINEILKNKDVVDITRKIYSGMGYDMDKMMDDGKLVLDLYPRKNKNSHGFCFDIDFGKDARILANLCNDESSLETLMHEMGHAVNALGVPANTPYFDKDFASATFTEAIAKMMEDLPMKEGTLSEIVRDKELLGKFEASLKGSKAYWVGRFLEIIEFERDMYKNPDQDLAKLWQEKRGKYLHRDVSADNEWATIPHFITHPGYYQNYFRAELIEAQIYNKLKQELGDITKNKDTAKYLDENLFKYGASIDEYDLIKQFTGKEFSAEDFVKSLE
ncbi:M2 family metallopeptidase [bacterium]|nr:M2 family metallopeptidase [bacterium]